MFFEHCKYNIIGFDIYFNENLTIKNNSAWII